MSRTLATVARKEGLKLNDSLVERIIWKSDRNMRRALLMLEACKVKQ